MMDRTIAKAPNDPLGDEYLACYQTMLCAVADEQRLRTNQIGCMWPEQGPDYRPGHGFMVIGIATNGWEPSVDVATLDSDDRCCECASAAREQAASPGHPLEWVTVQHEGKGIHSRIGTESAFWRVTRKMLEQLDPEATCPPSAWWRRLAWTNLCKLAPKDGGNPRSRLYTAQLDHCCELLERELTVLRPAQALVVAGADWWWPFAAHLAVPLTPTTRTPVLGTARFLDTNLVFAERPEGKGDAEYVGAVIEAFHSLRHT